MSNTHPFHSRERFGSKLGLERITWLCAGLGNPQNTFRTIHIAGTNGKGSVAIMLANILQATGLRVGLYSSPHLVDYGERFQINGVVIDAQELQAVTRRVEEVICQGEKEFPQYGPVTEFEVATAVGFLYFANQSIDIAVIEVGLGGRLDATNIITPVLSIITPISFDHMDYLGNTLPDIAREKAGIIKQNVPVVSGLQADSVWPVLEKQAKHQGSRLYPLKTDMWEPLQMTPQGGELYFPALTTQPIAVGLVGIHQLENAATVLVGCQVLQSMGWSIPELAIRRGLRDVQWPGRLEVIRDQPLVIMDGAHNVSGFQGLANSLQALMPLGATFTFVVGMTENKEASLLDVLLPLAKKMIFTEASHGRIPAKDSELLKEYVISKGIEALAIPSLEQALDELNSSEMICICGSLYLIGEIKGLISRNGGKWLNLV